jgi:hypothetical protein
VIGTYSELVKHDPQNTGWQAELIAARLQNAILSAALSSPAAPGTRPHGSSAAFHPILQAAESLSARDPVNASWIEQRAAIHRRLALALMSERQPEQARQHAASAAKILADIPQKNVTGNIRLEKVMVLLASAELAKSAREFGGREVAAASCAQARDLLSDDAKASRHYAVQDAWVRIHLCLGEREAASGAAAYLAEIGYKQLEYQRILNQHSL